MAVPTTYLTSTKNLSGVLESVQKASVPPKFTYDFLKKLGYPSSSDRPIIPLFKAMRFVDQGGAPLDTYKRYRDANQAKAVMAEGMREAYADVFGVDQQAQNLSGEELKGVFARLSGKSDSVAEKMALTFKALATHANFAAPPAIEPPATDLTRDTPAGEVAPVEERGPEKLLPGLRLHHDIHVHLPPSAEIAVHDAIFRALRQNFGG